MIRVLEYRAQPVSGWRAALRILAAAAVAGLLLVLVVFAGLVVAAAGLIVSVAGALAWAIRSRLAGKAAQMQTSPEPPPAPVNAGESRVIEVDEIIIRR